MEDLPRRGSAGWHDYVQNHKHSRFMAGIIGFCAFMAFMIGIVWVSGIKVEPDILGYTIPLFAVIIFVAWRIRQDRINHYEVELLREEDDRK